jgi:hypothetical protein
MTIQKLDNVVAKTKQKSPGLTDILLHFGQGEHTLIVALHQLCAAVVISLLLQL